jgi:hypothetical protein
MGYIWATSAAKGTDGEKGGKFEKGRQAVRIEDQGNIIAASKAIATAQFYHPGGTDIFVGGGVVGMDALARALGRS